MFPSDRAELAERYAAWLAGAGTVRGLIGPREVPRLWERHLVNCAVLADLLPPDATVCDIGSGAGLPGLVLAIARPDLHITLIEPLLRRTTFLEEVVADLGLAQVDVHRGRAEEFPAKHAFDVVTSRAVAPLDRLLRWSMPLVAPGGALVALKGERVAEEIEEHRRVWQRMGCAEPEALTLGSTLAGGPTYAVRVSWADPSRVGLGGPAGGRGRGSSRARSKLPRR
ncbi:16S rRNA (guanine(527)-N(7))-methyltransferase RsmG [Nocardioides daejeonensis]|uniref:16S rRNA (guanine(527)-N(7))-methyltransferase RsmG n=1 Tax=Nocardioides daejeonensis TaxID=1046556 RepID=UPI001EF56728|nr:16S rRNA (guanine(527)-N(7))-methyltransferase RsmG [Nocardioides daejeonensis]